MMREFSDLAVAHAIQLAVAPVFLLSAIGAILAVMTNRLSRIIDRARILEQARKGRRRGSSLRAAQISAYCRSAPS